MRKGENIFKRKDGRWEARYIKGYELSGKAIYGFCYGKSYREAKEKVTKCKALLLAGKPATQRGTRQRFAFYCDEWLQQKRNKIRESTYIKYDTILRKHIKPKLGACFPSEITTAVVERLTEELMSADGLSAKTVSDILIVLRGVLKYVDAQQPGIASVAEAIDIEYPKQKKSEARVLSRDEQEKFAKYLLSDTDACKFGVLLMLLSGIRIGELCALRWKDIDLKEQTLRINATLQRLHDTDADDRSRAVIGYAEGVARTRAVIGDAEGVARTRSRTRVVIGEPKSGTSARTIPLTDYTAELCRLFAADNPSAYVLTATEEYMEPRTLQYRISKYTKDCDLEGVHAHTLRTALVRDVRTALSGIRPLFRRARTIVNKN